MTDRRKFLFGTVAALVAPVAIARHEYYKPIPMPFKMPEVPSNWWEPKEITFDEVENTFARERRLAWAAGRQDFIDQAVPVNLFYDGPVLGAKAEMLRRHKEYIEDPEAAEKFRKVFRECLRAHVILG